VIVNNEPEAMWKETVVVYYEKVPSGYLPEGTEKNHEHSRSG
jgi:hypothetical protein